MYNISGVLSYGAHTVTSVVPGAFGHGHIFQPICSPDGLFQAVRFLDCPGTHCRLSKLQHGAWRISYDGGTSWAPFTDLGEVAGTLTAVHNFDTPEAR